MMSVLLAIVRAVAGRLLLAAVFGTIALLLAQQVVGNMVEGWGGPPAMTPAPATPTGP